VFFVQKMKWGCFRAENVMGDVLCAGNEMGGLCRK